VSLWFSLFALQFRTVEAGSGLKCLNQFCKGCIVTIEATAPTRVDLAGGTMDIEPLYLFHAGAQTVNFAIDLLATCKIKPRNDDLICIESKDTGFILEARLDDLNERSELELLVRLIRFFRPSSGLSLITECSAPPGSGLGGSSALNIAVCGALNAFTERGYDKEQLLTIARSIETQVIRVPAGVQDYYPAMYGGSASIELKVEGIEREEIRTDLSAIEARTVLCYTGKPHFSGTNNWEIFKRHIDGDAVIFEQFERIRDTTVKMRHALIEGDLNQMALLLDEEWQTRKELAPGVTTPKIEQLIAAAREAGSLGAKVCGAGGGGCVTFITAESKKSEVAAALTAAGGIVLDFKIPTTGLEVKEI
jgi:D-glycero-alpha-D-manno-heptose-7-phosphate kinase